MIEGLGMIYVVVNEANGKCEGVYSDRRWAELLKRNLEIYHKEKGNFKIYSGNMLNRPSNSQWFRINEIEQKRGIQFVNITKQTAQEFISKNFI